jgi:tetratricopeptide (TPR) repeat protein
MPIDRTAALRNAEKLLRQGKLDLAIAEYLRIVEDQPGDWNTTNLLGDLYVRAGMLEAAVQQFTRIADGLYAEGFLPKAAAVYKKILKLQPNAEHALLQAGEIAARQGLMVDARTLLQSVAEQRRSRGDTRGAAEVRVRLGTLDAADYDGRIAAAGARVELGDSPGAVADLKAIAAELTEKERPKEAVAALREAVRLAPEDAELKSRLARALVELGDTSGAAEYLNEETAGTDVRLLMTLLAVRLRSGRVEEGLAIGRRILNEDSTHQGEIASLGWAIAADAPEAGFRTVELVADHAVGQHDWETASATLQEFVTRTPNHIPALMRLIEVCVDGGLESTMQTAQAQLCDAYWATGSASEARFIAEDLLTREPNEPAHIERLRKALVLAGEPDPEAVIAERLNPSASMSLDFSIDSSAEAPPDSGPLQASPTTLAVPVSPVSPVSPGDDGSVQPEAPEDVGGAESVNPASSFPASHFALSDNAIDLDSALNVEIDLSVVLDDIKSSVVQLSSRPREVPTAGASGTQPAAARETVAATDLEGVFEQLRGEVARRSSMDLAQAEFQRGIILLEAGDIEGGIRVLKAAWAVAHVQAQE